MIQEKSSCFSHISNISGEIFEVSYPGLASDLAPTQIQDNIQRWKIWPLSTGFQIQEIHIISK